MHAQTKQSAIAFNFDPETMRGWTKLNANEQESVRQATLGLEEGILQEGNGKLAIGKHLHALQIILEPKRMFVGYLKNFRGFSRATAYRYIANYLGLSEKLASRPKVLDIALAKGFNRLTPEAIDEVPLPKTEDPTAIVEYLESVETMRKPAIAKEETSDPDILLKECYNFCRIRIQRVPNVGRSRSAWMKKLVGMLLTEADVKAAQSFSPLSVPENFRVRAGRPKEEKAA